MKIPTKKLKSGFEIPTLALGTWQIGGGWERSKNYQDEEKDIVAIRFDTAEVYADGYSEEILGRALAPYNRPDFFITSKVWKEHLAYDDVLRSSEKSLNHLGVNYLDLYLIHAPNPNIPIKDTMRALSKLCDEGLIKNVGVSNFGVESFKEAQEYSEGKIVLNQVHYNLIFREPVVEGLLEYCQNNDVFLEAWRPLQKGNLTKSGIEIVDRVCKKYGKTPAQVAMNWLIAQKNVVTLFKTSSIEHLEENMGAVGWEMNQADIDLLTNEFPIQLSRSNAVNLG
jgi:diketogulonate reductase-like aldo/keto reductase